MVLGVEKGAAGYTNSETKHDGDLIETKKGTKTEDSDTKGDGVLATFGERREGRGGP